MTRTAPRVSPMALGRAGIAAELDIQTGSSLTMRFQASGPSPIVRCPHCFTRVIASTDNVCPACHENVLVDGNGDPTLTSMVIRPSSWLPQRCYRCDSPTSRFVTVRRSSGTGDDNLLVRLLTLLSSPFDFIGTYSPSSRRSVKIKMPQCSRCGRLGEPEPGHVDFERFEVTFVVSRRFRERATAHDEN